MRIKRLQITGFKSFKDPVVFHFDNDVTGVVGPNGCGKSNVVDAIRWAMGEQSARHLRGSSMEDVIFGGSEHYGPLGMAEVILTFENEGDAPPTFAEYAEIAVGRRLFRSGESEYFINKTPCRLMDVIDFFLGTGVGTKAYSIIEQGRVGQIVASKPLDRRSIIEEAAGITKYKVKKRAALRKMEATEQNLTRVRDILGEIKRRIGSLERQARKAEKYKRLRTEMRELDLWIASHRYLELSAQQRRAEREGDCLAADMKEAQEKLLREESQVEALRDELAEREREIFALERERQEAANLYKLHESQLDHLVKEASALTRRNQESEEEVGRLQEHLTHLESEAAQLALEATDCQAQRENVGSDLERRSRGVAALVEERSAISSALEMTRDKIAELRASQERLAAEKGALEHRRQDLAARVEKARAERDDLLAQLQNHEDSLRSSREALSEVRQLKLALEERSQSAQEELKQLRARTVALDAALISIRTSLGDKRSRQRSLQEIEERLEGYADGVRAVMGRREEFSAAGVRGLVADVLSAPAELEPAVEAALGDRLQSVIVSSHETGLEAIDYLKSQTQGRSTFIPLSMRSLEHGKAPSVERDGVVGHLRDLVQFDEAYAPIVHYLLGDVTVVRDLQTALRIWGENGHRARLVTLDGDILDPWGVITGGSRQGPGWGLLQQKREMKELGEEIAALEGEYAAKELELAQAQEEIVRLQTQLDALRQDAHSQDLSIAEGQKDIDRAEGDLKRIGQRLEVLAAEDRDIEEARAKLASAEAELHRRVQQEEQARASLEGELPELTERAAQARDRVEAAQAELTELKVLAGSLAEKAESISRSAEANARAHEKEVARIEKLSSGITSGLRELEELADSQGNARREMARLADEESAFQERFQAQQEAFGQRRETLLEGEAGLKRLRDNVAKTRDASHETRQRGIEATLALEHLAAQIEERHAEELRFQIVLYHGRDLPTETDAQRLLELRKSLERMGEVNVTAIEEFEELQGRHEYLSAQEKDLAESLDTLRRAITRINRTSRERFQETFEAVNTKFRTIFPRLFRGGRATLQLTESDDILEAGVEIVAQPPGKKLSNINLLSGGEKALTAVALIFSIFLVKPSPFCLLDEVDAPLDDANIGQFNQIVKDMSRHSQFILITHNKRTMEIAETLYGVTMQEPGVSTLVSVEMKQEQAAA